jgi:hypothetical protein
MEPVEQLPERQNTITFRRLHKSKKKNRAFVQFILMGLDISTILNKNVIVHESLDIVDDRHTSHPPVSMQMLEFVEH